MAAADTLRYALAPPRRGFGSAPARLRRGSGAAPARLRRGSGSFVPLLSSCMLRRARLVQESQQ